MMARIFINTLFFFSFIFAFAQEYEVEDTYDEVFTARHSPFLTFRNYLLSEDYLMGLEFGAMNPGRNLSLFASFDLRPFRKKILNHQGGNLFHQHAEQRFFIGIGAEYLKTMKEKNYGVFIQLNGSYTWAYYGGTEVKPPKGFVLNPKTGIFWRFAPSFFIKGGYAYQDTKNNEVEKHRLFLAITGLITNQ